MDTGDGSVDDFVEIAQRGVGAFEAFGKKLGESGMGKSKDISVCGLFAAIVEERGKQLPVFDA